MIWTLAFWQGAGERALKTFLQTFIPALLLALGASASGTLNVWTAPWLAALQVSVGLGLGAAFLSLCTSIGNANFTAGPTVSAPTTSDVAVIDDVPDVIPAGIPTITSSPPAEDLAPAQP